MGITTIQIDESLKKKLDSLKFYHRESYNDLIKRMVANCNPKDSEKESLIETIEVMSEPETMREIAGAIEDYSKGRFKTLEQVEKELGIDK